jgi:hypothetical protein
MYVGQEGERKPDDRSNRYSHMSAPYTVNGVRSSPVAAERPVPRKSRPLICRHGAPPGTLATSR